VSAHIIDRLHTYSAAGLQLSLLPEVLTAMSVVVLKTAAAENTAHHHGSLDCHDHMHTVKCCMLHTVKQLFARCHR
jgi:L-amino acid N-acyltransferase YncA